MTDMEQQYHMKYSVVHLAAVLLVAYIIAALSIFYKDNASMATFVPYNASTLLWQKAILLW